MIKRVLLAISLVVISFSIVGQSLDWTDVIQQANQGETKSMYVYSYYSIYGEEYGIKKDYSGAVEMLNKLVSKKNVTDYVIMGYELLGDCYEKGYGVTENIETAIKWWTLAADSGSEDAKNKLKKYKPLVVPDLSRIKVVSKEDPKPEPKSASEQIYTAVEQKAVYPGGDAALLQWISSNIQYPTMAQEEGVEGRVIVQFVVEKDGSIGMVKIARGKHKDLDAEAVRVVKAIPEKFIPAKQNGQTVRSWFTLPVTFKSKDVTTTVNGVSFKMVYVKGGSFQMGSNDVNADDNEKPLHSVTLSDYYIGETEVTQELWEAVMGSNPSAIKGSKKPVEMVSWYDCRKFIRKLNQLTGMTFRLPTEAEWEYAARGGNKSQGYKYSGSNNIDDVAWYDENACDGVGGNSPAYGTHSVGFKSPNELGIYDMSGNVWEWCADLYGKYSSSAQSNPTGRSSGSSNVLRGGSWNGNAQYCRVAIRNACAPNNRSNYLGFRLVCSSDKIDSKFKEQTISTDKNVSSKEQIAKIDTNKSLNYKYAKCITEKVNGVSFKMIKVEGGAFKMGAQSGNRNGTNYDSEAYSNEMPVRSVSLSDYYIGETEVTQELWEAVMGRNPSEFKGSKKPVESVSWNDCQKFIKKLNQLTGKTFRLPTEAEWEYAARGGNKSQGYKYSGSNNIDDVAWYWGNAYNGVDKNSPAYGTHQVGTKFPNELGLYDMSGNVREWCNDRYGDYTSSSQTNPTGPSSGDERVLRGGSWIFNAQYCRVANRVSLSPSDSRNLNNGFRLVFCP